MTKDKKVNLLTGAILAAALVMTAAFPASAKEERTPVGHITLNFDADVQAGDMDASVSVSVEDGSCSVESADFVNEQEYWAGGVKPKVEVWLSADSDCYFSKSGKAAFTFNGDKVKYVSSATKYDKELLKPVSYTHLLPHFTASGYDEAQFLISTNPGQPVRPLMEVASGGELSRIMLAIKTVLADSDDIPTLIFDEIDTGISGRTDVYKRQR